MQIYETEYETVTLWKTARRFRGRPAENDPTRFEVPILFAIPYDAQESNRKKQISWHLTVQADAGDIDYKTELKVRVFRTEESREDFVLDKEQIREFLKRTSG